MNSSPSALASELLRRPEPARMHHARNSHKFHTEEVCRVVLDRSHELRFSDAKEMVRLALLAAEIATRCPGGPHADLLADVHSGVGNALKVRGLLRAADRAMVESEKFASQGSNRPMAFCVRRERLASLRIRQTRYREASEILEAVIAARKSLGEPVALAQAMLTQSIALSESGDPLSALSILADALPLVSITAQPRLALHLRHQGVVCHLHLGLVHDALLWLERLSPLYRKCGDEIVEVRHRWLRAKVLEAFGSEKRDCLAELEYREALSRAEGSGLPYEAAKIALDSALFFAVRGRYDRLSEPLAQAATLFNVMGISRDALVSRLLAQCAKEHHLASELLRQASRRLQVTRIRF